MEKQKNSTKLQQTVNKGDLNISSKAIRLSFSFASLPHSRLLLCWRLPCGVNTQLLHNLCMKTKRLNDNQNSSTCWPQKTSIWWRQEWKMTTRRTHNDGKNEDDHKTSTRWREDEYMMTKRINDDHKTIASLPSCLFVDLLSVRLSTCLPQYIPALPHHDSLPACWPTNLSFVCLLACLSASLSLSLPACFSVYLLSACL